MNVELFLFMLDANLLCSKIKQPVIIMQTITQFMRQQYMKSGYIKNKLKYTEVDVRNIHKIGNELVFST